jgi:hypothetical protein
LLSFAFFYLRLFFRIETFQWVTADSNKIIPVRGSGCIQHTHARFSSTRPGHRAGSIERFIIADDHRAGFGFMQENVPKGDCPETCLRAMSRNGGLTMARFLRKIFSLRADIGWLVVLIKPLNRALTMWSDVDLISEHFGRVGDFLNTGWGTLTAIVLGTLIISSSLRQKTDDKETIESGHRPNNSATMTLSAVVLIAVIGFVL